MSVFALDPLMSADPLTHSASLNPFSSFCDHQDDPSHESRRLCCSKCNGRERGLFHFSFCHQQDEQMATTRHLSRKERQRICANTSVDDEGGTILVNLSAAAVVKASTERVSDCRPVASAQSLTHLQTTGQGTFVPAFVGGHSHASGVWLTSQTDGSNVTLLTAPLGFGPIRPLILPSCVLPSLPQLATSSAPSAPTTTPLLSTS